MRSQKYRLLCVYSIYSRNVSITQNLRKDLKKKKLDPASYCVADCLINHFSIANIVDL